MHKLFCIVGRTGSGKDTITNAVADKFNLNVLKSYTTRPKRSVDEDTHIFVKPEDFELYQNDIVAYTEINNYKYFCTRQQLDNADFYIIDPNGIDYLTKAYTQLEIIPIYISVPEHIRRERALNQRKDNAEIFESRNKNENQQFEDFEINHKYKYKILNNNLNHSKQQLINILSKEGVIHEVDYSA